MIQGYFHRTTWTGRSIYYWNGVTAAFLIPRAHQDVLWEFIDAGYVTADNHTTTLRLNGSDENTVRVVQLGLTCCGRQLWAAASTLNGSGKP